MIGGETYDFGNPDFNDFAWIWDFASGKATFCLREAKFASGMANFASRRQILPSQRQNFASGQATCCLREGNICFLEAKCCFPKGKIQNPSKFIEIGVAEIIGFSAYRQCAAAPGGCRRPPGVARFGSALSCWTEAMDFSQLRVAAGGHRDRPRGRAGSADSGRISPSQVAAKCPTP